MFEDPPKKDGKDSNVTDLSEWRDKKIKGELGKKPKKMGRPTENYQPRPPEITMDEAKQIFQDIFENFEPRVWHLHGLAKKAHEKFDAYEHLVASGEYSEGHYRSYVSQQQPHRLGSKLSRRKEIPQIFSEDEKRLYGKIYGYEKEFKQYLDNFLMERDSLKNELNNAHSHLKNVKGAEELSERLEKYLEKIDFDPTAFILTMNDLEGFRKKIEAMEEFVKKLVN